MQSTHNDWHPDRVDLLTIAHISRHFGVPLQEVRRWVVFDPAFPDCRRNGMGEKIWRLPDAREWFDGLRNSSR